MKRYFTHIILSTLFLLVPALSFGENNNLPTTEILGKEYYYYEIKKGDSIYGITNRFGWDEQILRELNPEATTQLKKGIRLYYPVKKGQASKQQNNKTTDTQTITNETISHTVKKGETVYSISKLYSVPVETIYKNNSSARNGIKAGEKLIISSSDTDGVIYYSVKSGDTLFSLAKQYNTSVEDLLRQNPGISETNFKSGSTIKIIPDNDAPEIRKETVQETRIDSFNSYKVQKDDTWDSVADKAGVDVADLKNANEGIEFKKNETIILPNSKTVTVEKEYLELDPREATSAGRKELYESVHNIDNNAEKKVSVALILENPTTKKDQEFSRGFLIGVDRYKNSNFKIDLKVYSGDNCDNLTKQADLKNADIIVATFEKDFPKSIADFGKDNSIEVINVFDLKNELFSSNPSMIQLLPPSSYFNESAVDYISNNFKNRKLLMVGNPDSSDQIGEQIKNKFSTNVRTLSAEELNNYSFNPSTEYIIYCYPTRKDEALKIIDIINSKKEENPFIEISTIGRPSWITFAANNEEKLGSADLYIPSRFYFDEDDYYSKQFVQNYKEMFGKEPMKSFPMYAVTGYDVASYFLPEVARNSGDFNVEPHRSQSLQSDINIQRVSNWGGFVNIDCYMLHFTVFGTTEKIKIQ
jgi:LysM repeat protein